MTAYATPRRPSDRQIALALFIGTTVLVGVTAESIGFTRDEGYYFKAAEGYVQWFRAVMAALLAGHPETTFQSPVIDQYWAYNHEHPVLMKTLYGLSWGLLKAGLGIFSLNSTAFRFPAFLMAGLSVALTYLLARQFLGRAASLSAALMWLSLPRPFWDMHLACFDIPVCAAHLGIVYAYVRGRHTARGAAVVGVVFGLGAAVKHNVLLTPAVLFIHWVLAEAPSPRRAGALLRLPALPMTFIAMGILGPIVFVAHWPYLWPDVLARYRWYIDFHLHHEHFPILYFGELLTHPPFPRSFIYVMTAVTTPVPVLVLFMMGALLAAISSLLFLRSRWRGAAPPELTTVPLRSRDGAPSAWGAMLLLGNACFPFALWLPSTTPIFGGTKHWMNALPFLCILAAWALEEALTRGVRVLHLRRRLPSAACMALGTVFSVLPGFVISARAHPYGLSSYNELVGFARGAANIGFQRTFWGHEPRLVLPEINARTSPGGQIYFGDTNYDDWRMYVRDQLLRRDIGFSKSVQGSAVASVQPQGEFKEQWMEVMNAWNTQQPDIVVHVEGVPLLTVTFTKEETGM